MANNAIASGSVVLSANADQLLSGLDRAKAETQHWAADTSKTASKAAERAAGKGGLFGGMLGKAGGVLAGGFVGGLVGSAVMGLVGSLPDMLEGIKEATQQGDGGGIARMMAAFDEFGKIGAELLATVLSPMAPALERAAQIAQEFWARLQPIAQSLGTRLGMALFSLVEMTGAWLNAFMTGLEAVWPLLDRVFRAFEVGMFLFETVTVAIYDGIASVIKGIADWIGSWLNLEDVTLTVSQAIFKALKFVAQGAGYVWDAFKYGAGVIAEAFGKSIEVALKAVIGAFKAVLSLAKELPASIRPDWLDGFIGAIDKADGAVNGLGERIEKWGANAQKNFGQSAKQFGDAIDGLQAKFDARQKLVEAAAHKKTDEMITKVELVGAMSRGSAEAYSNVTKFQVGSLFAAQNTALGLDATASERADPVKLAQKQLDATRQMNRILERIEKGMDSGQPLKVIN